MNAATHPFPRPGVLRISPYVPGRSTATGGVKSFKLSSNETPLGASPHAIAAYKAAGDRLTRCLSLPVAGARAPLVRHDGVTYRLIDLPAPAGFRAALALAGAAPFDVRTHPRPPRPPAAGGHPKALTHR